MTHIQRYTLDLAVEHMVLLEDHFEDFAANPTEACIECMYKHLSAIAGLAAEGVQFFPEDKALWIGVMVWARGKKRELSNLNREKALRLKQELREHRKKIEKLDSEVFGSGCIACETIEKLVGHIRQEHIRGG